MMRKQGFTFGACVSFADLLALPEEMQDLLGSYLEELMDLSLEQNQN